VLVLGSSRVQGGLRAGALSRPTTGPVVFNFGMTSAGPVAELLCLRRLLADGLRPDHVFVEVLPAYLVMGEGEVARFGVQRLSLSDLALLHRYTPTPRDLSVEWCKGRLVPSRSFRSLLLYRVAPSLLPDGETAANPWKLWQRQDATGWFAYPWESVTAEEYRRGLAHARREYRHTLANFHVAEAADRALRELLDLCRQEGVGATLLLMPEGTDFQSMYPPAARAALDAYLARLRRDRAVELIDARGWIPDGGFWDSHHLLPAGAAAFTRRFEREALRPLFPVLGSTRGLRTAYFTSAASTGLARSSSLGQTARRGEEPSKPGNRARNSSTWAATAATLSPCSCIRWA
jgi:hypothetical protein